MSLDQLLAEAISGPIRRGGLAGAVALIASPGEPVIQAACGWRDIEAARPMTRDTLFRIASLSKPVTSVAALMLYDEGRFALEDPITDWAPELADLHVLRTPESDLDDTVPAERPITFAHLLTHTSGLTYGGFHPGPMADAFRRALGADIDSEVAPDDWIRNLAGLPLIDQPGRGFHYGASTDLLGFLIARMEGRPLGEVLRARIFEPLGMADTSFDPPPELQDRKAVMYGFDDQGALQARPAHPPEEPAFLAARPPGMSYVSGGAGLWSTADDYLRFARLFVGEGASEGVRLLKVSTLRRMTANWLTEAQRAEGRMLGRPAFRGHGFGLGVAVVMDPSAADPTVCQGGEGAVGWPGAYGGWWQADPTTGTVAVFLAHNAMDLGSISRGVGLEVYSAVLDVHALATA